MNICFRQSYRRSFQHLFSSYKFRNFSTQLASRPETKFKPEVVDFKDSEVAYASKTIWQLIRGLAVFRLCGVKPLVHHAEQVMKLSYKLVGPTLTNQAAKLTFFGHFCAGEDREDIAPTVHLLEKYGMLQSPDIAAPKDTNSSESSGTEHLAATDAPSQVQYMEGKVVSRVYEYANEEQCDKHRNIFMHCIRSVHAVSPTGFAAIKLTALGNPLLLERISTAIVELRKFFQSFDADTDGIITRTEFIAAYDQFFTDVNSEAMHSLLNQLDPDNKGTIDYIQWTSIIKLEDLAKFTCNCRTQNSLVMACLDDHEVALMQAMQQRLETLAVLAVTLGVRMMIDAEHSYFQPAIDYMVAGLQAKYNRNFPAIFSTYQMYMKDSFERLVTDMTRAERQGFHFAAKLVRGAYMVLERARALEHNYPDPILPTIEHTHANYHKGLEEVLERMANGRDVEVMVATHNQKTIVKTLEKMNMLQLPPTAGVYFGQLLGMADHLTFSLGHHGYKAYKYVPYGPVGEVMPYLVRRAQENHDVLGGAAIDQAMLWKELRRRMKIN